MASFTIDPYLTLGVSNFANTQDIKSAYRELVKKHHPDAGGNEQIIVEINAAWEILRDPEKRIAYDKQRKAAFSRIQDSHNISMRNARASAAAKAVRFQNANEEDTLTLWLKEVYTPINRLLGQVINPFPKELKALSADPYDDELMSNFCSYLTQSQKRMQKVYEIYSSITTPRGAKEFGLSLYHCLSQVKDALDELERYTMGYVDNYLHDGREMLRKAKQRRGQLNEEKRRLKFS